MFGHDNRRPYSVLWGGTGKHTHTHHYHNHHHPRSSHLLQNMCKHTHTLTQKQPRLEAFHYSSIPYVWLSAENPDLRPESGLNLKDERERLRNEVEDWAEREREHCWKLYAAAGRSLL